MSKNKVETAIYVAFDDLEAFDTAHSEKDLLKAVLTSAMSELNRGGPGRREAIRYFLDPDDEYVFSFQSVCSYLNIPPKQILIVTGLAKDADFMCRYKKSVKERNKAFGAAIKES